MDCIVEFVRAKPDDKPAGDTYVARLSGRHAYKMRVQQGPYDGGAHKDLEIDWDRAWRVDLEQLRQLAQADDLQRNIGDRLRQLLEPAGWTKYEAEILHAGERREPVSLTIRSDAGEIYLLPWELLTIESTRQHLGGLEHVHLAYAWPDTKSTPMPESEVGGTILVAYSDAGGAVPADDHALALHHASNASFVEFDRTRDILPRVTLRSLDAALARATVRGRPVSVLHILCHGRKSSANSGFELVWHTDAEDHLAGAPANEDSQGVSAARLQLILDRYKTHLRLVVLCACDGGNPGPLGTRVGSVVQELHRMGIQWIIGSRYPLTTVGSIEFTRELYGGVCRRDTPLDRAFSAARQKLATNATHDDWRSLQLYARHADRGQVLDLHTRPTRIVIIGAFEHPFAQVVSEHLARERHQVLLDRASSDEQWKQEMDNALHEADFVIALLSEEVINNKRTKAQLIAAQDTAESFTAESDGRRLQPVILLVRVSWHAPFPNPMDKLLAPFSWTLWDREEDTTRVLAELSAALMGALLPFHSGETRRKLLHDQIVRVREAEETPCAEPADAHDVDEQIVETLGALWHVPELPPHCLARQEDTTSLIEALCAKDGKTVGITGVGKHGLYGMGGIGKSVLAAQIAYNPVIRSHFIDGIYWLTVGQTPPLALLHSQLGRALGVHDVAFESLAEGKHKLTEYLKGKRVLLILDDVWRTDHASWLEVISGSGRILMTTRNLDVLVWRGAVVHSLDVMSREQARLLLADWTDTELVNLPEEAARVADECGRLPLALAIAGALVRRPSGSWTHVLKLLRAAQLKKLRSQEPSYPYRNVYQVIEASLTQLVTEEDVDMAEQCYTALAVFAEDEDIPKEALRILWGYYKLDHDEVDELASLLATYSLVIMRSGDNWCLRLHDIQRAYVQACTDDITALHANLVEAYALRCESAIDRGPTTGRAYFFRWLPYHLVQARHLDRLRQLWCSYEWLDGKLRELGVSALLDDFERYGANFETSYEDDQDKNRWFDFLRDSLRLSSHVIDKDPDQLPTQLIGRLQHLEHLAPQLSVLLNKTRARRERHWLCPLVTTLARPGGPLLRTFEDHSDWVKAVALNVAGTRALSGSDDCTLKVWDTKNGQLIHTLSGHAESIWSVALNEDGSRAVSGADDGTIKLWDTVNGVLLRTFAGHSQSVQAVALSADGTRVLSGSLDGVIKVWDAAEGRVLQEFTEHSHSIRAIALSADGARALSGSADGTLFFWNTFRCNVIYTLEGHSDSINAVALNQDGSFALSGSSDGCVNLWDTVYGRLRQILGQHALPVLSVALNADGTLALSGSQDRTVGFWDIENCTQLCSFEGHADSVRAVALSANGALALSGSSDNTVKLWDTRRRSSTKTLAIHSDIITTVALSSDGTYAATGSSDQTVKLWDTSTGQVLGTFDKHCASVNAVSISPKGTRAISGADDMTIEVWDPRSGQHLLTIDSHVSEVNALAINGDGSRVFAGYSDGALKLWDTHSGQLIRDFGVHMGAVNAVSLSLDGSRVLTSSTDNTVKLWKSESGEMLQSFEGPALWISTAALSTDGTHALVGSPDGTVTLFDMDTGKIVSVTNLHSDWVRSIAMSADGKHAVSCSDDRTLVYWDIQSGQMIAKFIADAAIWACALAVVDAGLVVVGDKVGGIHSFRLMGPMEAASGIRSKAREITTSMNTTINMWALSQGDHSQTRQKTRQLFVSSHDDAMSEPPSILTSDIRTRITRFAHMPQEEGTSVASLVLIYPPGADMGKRFHLDRDEIVLGRGSDCDLVVDRDSVSRRHALVYRSGHQWRVRDLDSTNGSYVNDTPIIDYELTDADLLRIGAARFKFLNGDEAAVEASYFEEIYHMTIIDGLTGAHNKRYLLEFLEREVARCSRHRRPLSLLMFDIDHFKSINDTRGSLTGDFVLREMCHRLLGRIRKEQLLARYGGEEFAVVLPEIGHEEAMYFAEKVRQIVCNEPFSYDGERFSVTISVGVHTLTDGIDPDRLVEHVNRKLDIAKRIGRNCVVD